MLIVVTRIGIRVLKQNTNEVLARVIRGESIEITRHGHPVARLVPVADETSALARLVASGRAVAPSDAGPVPLPPRLGDPAVDVASKVAAKRDEEHS